MAGKITQAAEIELSVKGAGTVKSIKTELREAKEEAIAMSREFGAFSPEALQAQQRLANLKDEVEDLGHRVNALNPDKFSQIGTAAASLAHGFSAAQGAAALFGAESENVQKAMMQVQGAMALSQGLMGLKDAKEGLLALAGTIKSQVVAAFSTMKGAIMSTGIGALVIAIGGLIMYFKNLAAESEATSKALAEDSTRNFERTQANINAEITLRKAAGKETLALERELLLNQLTANEISLRNLKDKYEKERAMAKAFGVEQVELGKEQKDELAKLELDSLKIKTDITAMALTAAKKERDDAMKIAEEKAAHQKQLNEKSMQDAKANRDKAKKDREQDIADELELETILLEMEEEEAKKKLDIEAKFLEDKKKLAEDAFAIAQKNTADFYLADKTQLVNDLVDKKLTREEYAQATAQLEVDNLTNMLNDAVLFGQSTLDIEKQQADLRLAQADEAVKKQIELNLKERESKMLLLNSTLSAVKDLGVLLANEGSKAAKVQKAFALAQIGIDTAQAISSLMKNSEANPANAVTGGIAGIAQFASGIARIIANVAKATQLLKAPSPSLGSGAGGGGASPEPAQFSAVGQDIKVSKLGDNTQGGTGDKAGPQKVFVVESDIRKVSRRVEVVENGGTL